MTKFKSDALRSVHESAKALHKAGAIDKITMRKFDRMALKPIETISAQEIKAVREANNVSQAVFAGMLNTSLSTVQKWETGAKGPSGPALKLLDVVKRHGLAVLQDGERRAT